MDALRDRLADLAGDAPTGGAPAAELWAHGNRAHRLRAAALVVTVLVVLASVGTGIGARLADGDDDRSSLASAGGLGISLPIEYPDGEDREELPDLGHRPGPLAAVWVAPRVLGGGLEAVGLVAETGAFGVLPIDASYVGYEGGYVSIALSPDGRRIAYTTREGELTVRDLMSGEERSPAFDYEIRGGYSWFDATHLVGLVASGSDADGWVWEPDTAPKLVNPYTYPGSPWLVPYGGRNPWFAEVEFGRPCSSPALDTDVPELCDDLGRIGYDIVLTHWSSDVVALDRTDFPLTDPALRRVVVTAGAPQRVTFATDLIAEALGAGGGAS